MPAPCWPANCPTERWSCSTATSARRRRPTWRCRCWWSIWTTREAAKLLAVHDPLAGMAEANEQVLAELLADVDTESEAVQGLLDQMLADAQPAADDQAVDPAAPPEVDVPECFQVVIECDDEDHQQAVYERLNGEGFKCRLLTL